MWGAPWPACRRRPGPYTVAVEDAFLPQNSGVYRVCAEGVTRVREKPDLETSVHALTQLVVGYCDMHMAAMRLDVRVCGNEAALSAAFPEAAAVYSGLLLTIM